MADGSVDRELALACLAFLDASPEEHVLAAASSGFDLVTLRVTGSSATLPAEVGHAPDRIAELRAVLDDSGVGVLDVEVLRMQPGLSSSDAARSVETAALLGARHLLVVNSGLERTEATDRLGQIVEQAAGTGVVPCLEPMLFSRCRTLADAVATAVPAGAAVLIDTLHLFRAGGGSLDVAESVRLHGSALFPYVQVCDAPASGPTDVDGLREEAVHARLLPGDGDIPLAELVSTLPPAVPLAVEAPTRALNACPPDVRARAAMRAVRGVLG